MRRLAVFAVFAFAACSMASLVTKTYELRFKSSDGFLSAIESRILALPDGVAVELSAPKDRATVVALSGEEGIVDQTLDSIRIWDKAVSQILVKCEVREGNRVINAPILRTLSGEPASITQSKAGAPESTLGIRVLATKKNRATATIRVSLLAGEKRLIVPYTLEGEEDVEIAPDTKGNLEVRVTNVATKAVRTARVSSDCKVFAGLVFAFRATVVADEG